MTLKENGFRELYHDYCAFMLNDKLRPVIDGFPGEKRADCILTYGYVDEEFGLTLEVLAAGHKEEDSFVFYPAPANTRSFIRAETIMDEEFFPFEDETGDFAKRFRKQLEIVKSYDASEEIEETRKMDFLDAHRHPIFVDDVMVYLMRDRLQPEGCWTHIIGLGEHFIMGVLLNEPNQNFGFHEGDRIAFFVDQTEDGTFICFSNMNPDKELKAEDLADGKMLRDAVVALTANRTEENVVELLELLRDSVVWVPCNAIMSDRDQDMIEKMVEESGDDLTKLIGESFANQDDVRLVPDILQNGDDFFFPVFSSVEEMGEYGEHFSNIPMRFLDAIVMAKNNDQDLKGIVVNAFSESYVLPKELYDLVEKMQSRIVE